MKRFSIHDSARRSVDADFPSIERAVGAAVDGISLVEELERNGISCFIDTENKWYVRVAIPCGVLWIDELYVQAYKEAKDV